MSTKGITYKQRNKTKGVLFGISYVVIAIGILTYFFSIIDIVKYVNDQMYMAVIYAFLGAIPLFLMKPLYSDSASITYSNDVMYVKIGSRSYTVRYSEIDKMIHDQGVKQCLDFYNQRGEKILTIAPVVSKESTDDFYDGVIDHIYTKKDFEASEKWYTIKRQKVCIVTYKSK